jgi:hypothetical protein
LCISTKLPEDRIILGNKIVNGNKDLTDLVHISICTDEEERQFQVKFVNADHPQVVEIWNNIYGI